MGLEVGLGIRFGLVFVDFRVWVKVSDNFRGVNEGRGKVLIRFYG